MKRIDAASKTDFFSVHRVSGNKYVVRSDDTNYQVTKAIEFEDAMAFAAKLNRFTQERGEKTTQQFY